MKITRLLILALPLFLFSGCASFGQSLKAFLGGEDVRTQTVKSNSKKVGKIDKNKNYKRTDHKTIQEQSSLGPDSGSLWIERGQGSYLFTQNTNRLIGDLVNVEIDGQAKKQIETKVSVIQNLLDRIKTQNEQRMLASQTPSTDGKPAAAPAPTVPTPAEPAQKFEVKIVPSRITEILKDGSYLVQGDQVFMLGKREYKLVVKGIVRQEDFDDQGISAETLLDPSFDIVTNKRKKSL